MNDIAVMQCNYKKTLYVIISSTCCLMVPNYFRYIEQVVLMVVYICTCTYM